MFSKAIVRTPGKSILNGLTTSNLGKPDFIALAEVEAQAVNAEEAILYLNQNE